MGLFTAHYRPVLSHRWARLALLGSLYMVQGLPFGFQVGALPVFLRAQGVSLAVIGYSTALAAPWALKIFWAPLVEGYGGGPGQRKRWIIPAQLIMVLGFLLASRMSLSGQLVPMMVLLATLNAAAATQDIAVDGLCVDLLPPQDLGMGNAAQVVGFKVGMLGAGGVLVWASAWLGWSGAFLVMAAFVAAVVLVMVCIVEPPSEQATEQKASVRELVRSLMSSVRAPGIGIALAVVGTYKMGESLIDLMYKPFLLDAGISASSLGLWLGTWGMGASVLGSLFGGLLATRWRLFSLLMVAGAIRLLPEFGQLALALGLLEVDAFHVISISLAEHFAGGALTTVMFATMMGLVDRRIGATHFTLFACVEVWGKSLAALFSGLIAESIGYAGAFGLGIGLGFLFLLIVRRLPRELEPVLPAG